jgi:hypothetical protein
MDVVDHSQEKDLLVDVEDIVLYVFFGWNSGILIQEGCFIEYALLLEFDLRGFDYLTQDLLYCWEAA